jgi:hypothetical protein
MVAVDAPQGRDLLKHEGYQPSTCHESRLWLMKEVEHAIVD